MTNAEATVRHALIYGLTANPLYPGLRAGPEFDTLLSNLLKAVRDPATAWAFREFVKEGP